MNQKTILLSILVIVVLLAGIPESFAKSQYLPSLITVYGDGSCGTCHVRSSGGGQLTSYGTQFENQANHAADPNAALKAIGQPPGTSTTTTNPAATATLTATTPLKEEITKEISDEEETEEETQTQEERETPETAAPAVTTVPAKVTPTAAGFGIVVSIVGLFVCAILVRRNNKTTK